MALTSLIDSARLMSQQRATVDSSNFSSNSSASTGHLLAEVHGEDVADLDKTLWHFFLATASVHPDREAIVCLWQRADGSQLPSEPAPSGRSDCLRWTYHDLQARAERLACALEKLGCRPTMRLAAVIWNSAEWALLFWATAKIGLVFVPIDPRAAADDIDLMLLSAQPQVLLVQDTEAVAALQVLDRKWSPLRARVRIHCSEEDADGWLNLQQLLLLKAFDPTASYPYVTTEDKPPALDQGDKETAALIVFTSGTTGEPKGCVHTNRNLVAQTNNYDPNSDASFVDRWLVHTPVCHIFAINNALRAWRYGGTVVFASKVFDVDSTLKALVQEQSTIMSATPTLVKALLAHSAFPSPQEISLSVVTIAGTKIETEDIRLCRQELGSRDAIQAYGMTEAGPVISWARHDELLVDGYHPGVGKVLPGAALRICRPGSHAVLQRLQAGELHIGGPCVIANYLGESDCDRFYSDSSGKWFMTGDQAMIDMHGVVHIVGRYKDLIIRGGENINPLKMESSLAELPGLEVQVVGTPDDVAGQVPVAVVKLPAGISKARVAEMSRRMGPQYTLDGIYTLEELGLESMPVTSIGKPKRALLASAIAKLRSNTDEELKIRLPDQVELGKLEGTLQNIWEQLTGFCPALTDNLDYLADSITLLRYCDSVLRTCNKQLYLQDLREHNTVQKQSQLLSSRALLNNSDNMRAQENRSQRLSSSTSAVETCIPYPMAFGFAPDYSNNQNKNSDLWKIAQGHLSNLKLGEHNLEDIIPIRYSLQRTVAGQRPQSYNVRIVFRIRKTAGHQVQMGLKAAISQWPIMRTFLCRSKGMRPYHAIVSPSEQLFQHLIHEMEVESEQEAVALYQDDTFTSQIPESPFMLQAMIIKTRVTNEFILCLTYSHSIVDALTLLPWHRDLDRLIVNHNFKVPVHAPYRLFADLFEQYQNCLPAQESILYRIKQLRGISRYKHALWPKQRAPGMMVANDNGSPNVSERRAIRAQVWKGEWDARSSEFRYPRRSRVVCLPLLGKLRDNCGLEPSMFTKCALVLFNVLQTGSPVAVFSSWESARTWPFMPKWIESLLPPAMSIGGPTVEWVLNMYELVREETLIEFFRRMIYNQEQLRPHEHAPWDKVVDGLSDEGDVAVDASFRQSFVWDVSMGLSHSRGGHNGFEALEAVSRYDWPDCGFAWNAFMMDKVNLFFIASWDTAQLNADEVDGFCDDLADVMRKLANEGNWNRPVGEVFSITK